MKKLIGKKIIFLVLGALLLSGCSGNTQPTTPKAKYFSTIKQLEKKCNEGLGTSRWCTVLAETSERPPSGVYPDAFQTSVYYGYAAYAAKRDCKKNNKDACKHLDYLRKNGKGGLSPQKSSTVTSSKMTSSQKALTRAQAQGKARGKRQALSSIHKARSAESAYMNAVQHRAEGRIVGTIAIGKYGRNKSSAYASIRKQCHGNRICIGAAYAKYNSCYR